MHPRDDDSTTPSRALGVLLLLLMVACDRAPTPAPEVLRSWSDGPVKQRILGFVDAVTEPTSASFVPPDDRIAVFDLDGTLIIERPLHLEVLVAMEKLREEAAADPGLTESELYRAVVNDDRDYIRKNGADIVTAAATGESLESFHQRVRSILGNQTHPTLERPYSGLFYEPMLELVELLSEREFRVYVVSQSQQEYIRAFAEPCFGLSAERIIGSTYAFERADDEFMRSSTVWEPYNRGEGKVLRIRERTGGLPIFAFGNGTGDRYVLEATERAPTHLVLFLDHDDPEREFVYGNERMLELARERSWEIVSLKRDFTRVFREDCLAPPNAD